MNEKLVIKYFEILHPEFESLNPAEQSAALDDKVFIMNNIETIDTYYCACQSPDTYAQEQGFTDKEIIQLAVEEEKARQQEELQANSNIETRNTVADIEEATQNIQEDINLIEIEEPKWYQKIFKKILRIFKK